MAMSADQGGQRASAWSRDRPSRADRRRGRAFAARAASVTDSETHAHVSPDTGGGERLKTPRGRLAKSCQGRRPLQLRFPRRNDFQQPVSRCVPTLSGKAGVARRHACAAANNALGSRRVLRARGLSRSPCLQPMQCPESPQRRVQSSVLGRQRFVVPDLGILGCAGCRGVSSPQAEDCALRSRLLKPVAPARCAGDCCHLSPSC